MAFILSDTQFFKSYSVRMRKLLACSFKTIWFFYQWTSWIEQSFFHYYKLIVLYSFLIPFLFKSHIYPVENLDSFFFNLLWLFWFFYGQVQDLPLRLSVMLRYLFCVFHKSVLKPLFYEKQVIFRWRNI